MSQFKDSVESIDSSLLLWGNLKPTNTSVEQMYNLIVNPRNAVDQDEGSTILFNIPPQDLGFLTDIEVNCSFKVVNTDDTPLAENAQVSLSNNISACLFSLAEVKLNEQFNLLQQMSGSYAYCHFFETILNNQRDRTSILKAREMFVLDSGANKAETEVAAFFVTETVTADAIKNKGAVERARAIAGSAVCTTVHKLNVPLLRQHKALVPGTRLSVTLTKNKNAFCLMAEEGAAYKIHITEIFLNCTYLKPHPPLIDVISSKLKSKPVVYETDKQLLLARLLPSGQQTVTVNNFFDRGAIPKFVLFAVNHPLAISGRYHRNGFTFCHFKSLQLYINNRQMFPKALQTTPSDLLSQMYKSLGRDLKGSVLIDSENLAINNFVCIALTDDRTFDSHYNLKRSGDSRIELEFTSAPTESLVLLAYCLFDRHISIGPNQEIATVE